MYYFILLFLLGLIALFFGVLAHFLKKHWYYTKVIVPRTMDWVFLEVQMPKGLGQDNKGTSGGISGGSTDEMKQWTTVGEQFFTGISNLGGQEGLMQAKEYISVEIACVDKKISFYVNCPKRLQNLVEKQIHAQYPYAFIDEVKIYNPFPENGELAASELQLSKQYYFPLRTYKSLETDSLNTITNAMSKLEEGEGAAFQLVIYPSGTEWQKMPRKMASQIQQGKSPEYVTKTVWQKRRAELWKAFTSAIFGKEEKKDDSRISLTPMQQEIVKRFEEKASRPGFNVNLRLIAASPNKGAAKHHLGNMMAGFLQFNMPPFNGLKQNKRKKTADIVKDYIFRIYRAERNQQILNTEELASLWHLPNHFLETPNIKWLTAKKAPPPIDLSTEGVLLGRNIYRSVESKVHISRDDRRRHMYIIGRTGVGKTEIMKNMAVQDIKNGEGLCVIDPHGDFIEDILPHVPKERAEDVIVFEPADTDRPMGLNMLDANSPAEQDFVVQEMISIFYKLVTDPSMLGPMFEHNMRNAMLTLMADREHPGTLVEIPRIFTDTEFQQYKTSKVKDPIVRAFWEKEMAKTSDFHKSEMLGYLISKVGRFVENSMMRNIVGQGHSSFNFRDIMDNKKVLLVNLAKGRIGEINAKLLGLILVSKIQMAALSRADIKEDQRQDFYLYVDEFQNFITDAFESILSEARKYRLNLIIAHQYLAQLESSAGAQGAGAKSLRDAVFGNAGSMVCFRIGVEDAEAMGKEMAPTFNEFDLVNIERFNCYMKLMIKGTASKPFNVATYGLPKPTPKQLEVAEAIRQLSRLKYGRPLESVEAEILEASMVADMMSAGPGGIEASL